MKKSELKEMIADVINEVRQEQHPLPEIELTEAEIDGVLTENAPPFISDRVLAESTMTLQEMEDSLRRDFEADAALLDEYMLFKEERQLSMTPNAIRKRNARLAAKAGAGKTTTGSGATTTTVDVSGNRETPKATPPKKSRKKGGAEPEPESKETPEKKGKPSKAAATAVAQQTVNVVINDMAKDNPKELAKLYKKLQAMEKRGKKMEEMLAELIASSKVQQAKKQVTPEITTTPPAPVPSGGPAKPGGLFSRIKNFVKDNKVGILVGLGTIAAVAGAAALAPAGIGSMIATAMASKTVRNAVIAGAGGLVGGTIAKKASGASWKDSIKSGLKTGLKAAAGGAVVGLGQDIADKFMGGAPVGDAARAASAGSTSTDSAFTGPGSGDNSNPDDYKTGDSAFNVGSGGNPSDAEQFPDDTDSGMVAGGGEEPRSNEPDAGEDDELASMQASRNAPLSPRGEPGDTNDDDDVQFGDKPNNLGAGSPPDDYEERYKKDQETAREDEEGVDTTPAGGNTDAETVAGTETGAASAAGNETPVATGEIGTDSENYGKLTTPAEKLGFAEDAAEKARERGDAENERFWQSYAEEERANLTGGSAGAASPAAAASAEPKMKENPDIYEDPRVDTKSNLRYADAEGNRYAEPGDGRTDTRKVRKEQYARLFVSDSKNPNVMKLKR